jgi:hypothetical protein
MASQKFQRSSITLPMLATLLLVSIIGNVWSAYHHVSVTQVIISVPPSPSATQERYERVPGSKEWHPNFGEPRQFCGMFGAEQCSHAT